MVSDRRSSLETSSRLQLLLLAEVALALYFLVSATASAQLISGERVDVTSGREAPDQIDISQKEETRERLQPFEGVVLSIKKRGLGSSFIVRKISNGVGVERTFQTHSPIISSIKVKRRGDVRQAKLFYLRERTGRSARIKEKLS